MHKSFIKSTSIISEKFDMIETESVSSMFEEAHMYKKEAMSCLSLERESLPKEGRVAKFNVLLVTSSKIYQGHLLIRQKKLTFS